MEIIVINKSQSKSSKSIKLTEGLVFVRMTEKEALATIESLISQINYRSSSSGRLESYDKNGCYFSISVSEFKKTKEEFEYEKQKEINLKRLENN